MRHINRLLATAGMTAGLVALSTGAAMAAGPEANRSAYWETYLEGEGHVDVQCDKRDSEGPFTVDMAYLAIILKAGAGDDQNQLIMNPPVGMTYETQANGKDISHVIYCTGGTATTPPTSTTTTSTTTPPTSTTSTSTTTPPTSTTSTSTTTPPTSTTTPPTSTTTASSSTHMPPPVAPTNPAGPQTPGVVQTDGGPMGGDSGALLGALGIAALLGTVGAAGVVGNRAASRRH